MKILLEKLQNLNKLEKIADLAESKYAQDPKKTDLENAFDEAYKNEYDAYIGAAKYIEYITGGAIDFFSAKKIVQTKRSDLINILNI